MKIDVCDKCGTNIDTFKIPILWDKSFSSETAGATWELRARGNYTNTPLDVCGSCTIQAILELAKQIDHG